MSQTQTTTLKRTQIREILRRHKGSITDIANRLGVRNQSVSMWLSGRGISARIAEAANIKAQELLSAERQNAA